MSCILPVVSCGCGIMQFSGRPKSHAFCTSLTHFWLTRAFLPAKNDLMHLGPFSTFSVCSNQKSVSLVANFWANFSRDPSLGFRRRQGKWMGWDGGWNGRGKAKGQTEKGGRGDEIGLMHFFSTLAGLRFIRAAVIWRHHADTMLSRWARNN